MKWYLIYPFLLFFPVLLLQISVVPLIAISGIIPDFILITLVYYSITRNQLYGTILGAFCGLLVDLVTGGLLGSYMLSKTLAGFVAGYFSGETKKDSSTTTYRFLLIVLLCATLDDVVFSFFSTFDIQTNMITLLFEQALIPSLYTAAVSVLIIFFPFRRRRL
ncbi:MAG: rod shape-determining protein MreD [Ignavibacteria bacterium]|jgi:rod shape-determining protein MreD